MRSQVRRGVESGPGGDVLDREVGGLEQFLGAGDALFVEPLQRGSGGRLLEAAMAVTRRHSCAGRHLRHGDGFHEVREHPLLDRIQDAVTG